MVLIFSSLSYDVLAVFATFCIGFITYFKWRFSYWTNKNIATLAPSIPFGNFGNIIYNHETQGVQIKKMYQKFKAMAAKHGGIYMYDTPAYIPLDPEMVRTVLAKDFQHFTDRGLYFNGRDQPISENLFFVGGSKWKELRQKLTSTFTSGKMKFMLDTMQSCTGPMEQCVLEFSKESKPLDMKDIAAKYSTDVIGHCAFGVECNSFKHPDAEFRKCGKQLSDSTIFILFLGFFQVFQKLVKFLHVAAIPKGPETFFTKAVESTVEFREKNNVKRNDFMQLLIDLKNSDENLSVAEIVGQAFIFFIAGSETTSGTISFCLFELAQHPEIQEKLRHEINSVLDSNGGEVSYESLKDLTYMDQCIDETLRKYPSLQVLHRICTDDYTFEDGLTIEKGTLVYIPVLALHHDPEIFPDPEKFDPDRFSKENKSKIHSYSYLPFGAGPRVCIGIRFGMMQVKLGLVRLVKNFHFTLNENTKLPFEFGMNFGTVSKHELLLNAVPIN